jgi:alpha-N-arabinofuranosidase
MANLAQTVNVLQAVILTDEEKMLLTPTYHVMKMYAVHQDATLVPLAFTSPEYQFGDERLPAISASASRDAAGRVHFSLVNVDAKKSHTITLDVAALGLSTISGEILTSASLQDHNDFANPTRITTAAFTGVKLSKGMISLEIPPFSVVVLEGK